MNPRKPYRPDRKRLSCSGVWSYLVLAAIGLVTVGVVLRNWQTLAPVILKPATPIHNATATKTPVQPVQGTLPALVTATATRTVTPTIQPVPSATATRAAPVTAAAVPTLYYTTQSGDTLPALAARFGITTSEVTVPEGEHLRGTTTLAEGQLLVIPQKALGDTTSAGHLIPDSELIFSGAAAGFDPAKYAREQGGYLAGYSLFADGLNRQGGDVILLVAQQHSLNPRLLTALVEYQGGWITQPHPTDEALLHPLGFIHPYRTNLYTQLYWAAAQLSAGYYGWRSGTLLDLQFVDGQTLRLDPSLNAGTVAVMYFFAQLDTRAEWDQDLSAAGFSATYQRLFGDPFAREMKGLIPADLTQPPLKLPFVAGHTWYFSGGPHGAWLHGAGGALAALDFAPGALIGGCAESQEWVTAMAAGTIVRVDRGVVMLDLDGDGREATGWVILYLHIATLDKIAVGTVVEAGDHIGHPSCEGGQSTGTHVHVARKYNGEWIPADSLVPFTMSGWVAKQGSADYIGSLVRGDQVVNSCTCTAAWTAVTADR